MSDYEIGDVARLTAEFKDGDTLVDPATVTLLVMAPDGTETTPTPIHDSLGEWHYDLPLPTPGRWAWRWTSSVDAQSAEEGELQVAATLLYDRPAWMPGPLDVAALLRSRIREPGGKTPDTFTDQTNPTRAQVQALIDEQAALVLIDVGDLSDEALTCGNAADIRRAVRTLIAQRVAGVVEGAYWPADPSGGATAQDFWNRLVEIDTPRVTEAARECRLGEDVPGGGSPGEGGIAMAPAYTFNVGARVGTRRW